MTSMFSTVKAAEEVTDSSVRWNLCDVVGQGNVLPRASSLFQLADFLI